MFLKSIEYAQFEGTPRLWQLEGCTFGNINLIVGKNATGKSRSLSVIKSLANLLSGESKLHYLSGNYTVAFDNNGQGIDFILHYENLSIIHEELNINSENKLCRRKDGIGRIHYAKRGEIIEFQTPTNELATVARRDTIQHPFLEDLYNWGRYVRHYLFGTELGKGQLAVLKKDEGKAEKQLLNPKDTNLVIAMFLEGRRKYLGKFNEAIVNKRHGGQVFSFGLSDDIMDWESGDTIPVSPTDNSSSTRPICEATRSRATSRAHP